MCTVTFIPTSNNNFVLTSNRDEAPNRATIPPEVYSINNCDVLFPRDEKAGGTWIGASQLNRTLCVLNGGFEFHERASSYRLSRGVIVKDLLVADDLANDINTYNFEGVEPFTLVIVDHGRNMKLHQLVWDGSKKHFNELLLEPTMWSSSSLYSKEMKDERQQWFKDFKDNMKLNSDSVLQFHKTAGKGNLDYGLIMDRFFVKTTSITQVVKDFNQIKMTYNYLDPKQRHSTLNLLQKIEK